LFLYKIIFSGKKIVKLRNTVQPVHSNTFWETKILLGAERRCSIDVKFIVN
jgi:hypothetical protein